MKRRFMALLVILCTLVGVLGIAIACKPEETPKVSGNEAGEYYCDYNGAEYSLNLGEECKFTLKIASETMEGEYVLEDETLTLNVSSGDPIAATYKNDTVAFSYKQVPYTFLRKVEYTFKYDTDGGSSIADVKVVNGRAAAQPADPTKEDRVFVGWYTDKTYKNVYHFSQPVTGDTTIYARFVEKLDPEFTVSFDANYAGAGQIDSVTTAGNMLYESMLPTPERTGYEFVGWYVSQFRDPAKLSYAYTDQKIAENITLYAVWDEGNPVVTVTEDGVEMSAKGANLTYALTITAPDGTTTTDSKALPNGAAASFDYDFASKAAGEYKVEVVVDGKTTTRYYNNKALARVSVFKVEGTTLLFNAVEGATEYTVTVVCGIEGHVHTDVSLKTNTSYDFKTCDMRPEGIDFVVTAKAADGYLSSTSDVFTYVNRLDAVANLAVDPATQVASWDAVEHATSYKVTVTVDGGTPIVENVGKVTSYSLKSFAKGDIKIEVVPVAYGWNSPDAAECTYAKTNHATPKNVSVSNNVVTWDEVPEASAYEVKVGGKTHRVTENSYELSSSEVGTSAEVTVSALGSDAAETSLPTEAITVKGAGKIENVVYHAGVVTWDPIFNATSYEVKLNGGEVTVVTSASAKVAFTQADKNTIEVRAIIGGEAQNEWSKLEVTAYEVELHLGGDENTIEKKYLAEGDPMELARPAWAGYDFVSWYTAPNGPKGEGVSYRDPYFGGGKMSLYAYFTPHVYTITFVTGDIGEHVDSIEVYYRQQNVVLPVAKSISYDYTFLGWYTENDGGIKFADEKGNMALTYFTELRDMTLYADWVALFTYTSTTGGWAVSKGDGLKYVKEATIPETHLGGNVVTVESFSSQTTLEILNIPNTVKTIELGSKATAFTGCSNLKAVNIYEVEDNRDPVYASKDGMVYEVEGNRLIFVPFAIGETVEIPEGIEELVAGAFYANTVVKEVHVPASVRTIQTEVFRSKSTTSTESGALERIYFTNDNSEDATLTIADKAFYSQRFLKVVSLPKQISTFASAAFYYCTAIEEINIIDSVETEKYYSVDGVLFTNTTLGKSNVREVAAYPAGNPRTEYTIPAGVESIGDKAFYEAKKLTSMEIPAEIRNIGTEAFKSCTGLLTLTFGGDADSPDLTINGSAFYGCNALTELTLPANLVSIGESAFGNTTKLTKVVVNVGRDDKSTVKFGARAFGTTSTSSTYYVTELSLGRYCPEVDIAGVFGNKVKTLTIDENNKRISTITEGDGSGALYNADKTKILYYMGDGKEFTIPGTVEEIPGNLFRANKKLEKINIPASVKKIGELAFEECEKLTTVNFLPDTETDKKRDLTIGANAFKDCTALASINLPEYTTAIGKTAFQRTAITELNLPKALKDINQATANANDLAIYNMQQLEVLTVSEGNTTFKAVNSALYMLKQRGKTETYDPVALVYVPQHADIGNGGKLEIPETVTSIFLAAARYNESIVDLEFADKVVTYDDKGVATDGVLTMSGSAFYQCLAIETVKLPEGLKELPTWAFYGCNKLKSVTIPSTVESITQSFVHCLGLETVTFAQPASGPRVNLVLVDAAASPVSTSYGAFGDCPKLTSIDLPEGTTYIGHGSFSGCLGLKEVTLPSTLTTVGKYAFYNATSLEEVTFRRGSEQKSVELLSYAFCNSSKLKSFDFKEGITLIDYQAFYKTGLSSVTLPSTLTTLGDYAFENSKIKSINMAKATKLEKIGTYAFAYSTLGGTVRIPASVTSIGTYTFYKTDIEKFILDDNSKLTSLPNSLFGYTSYLKEVDFGKNCRLESIGTGTAASNVFMASGIETLTIPASVKTLAPSAFRGAIQLNEITFEEGSQLTTIGDTAFQGTAIEEFAFPTVVGSNGSVATISLGGGLFSGCSLLKTVHLSASIALLESVFEGCASIKEVTIAEDNKYFSIDPESDEPIIYDKEGKVVRAVYGELSTDTLMIPVGVTGIDASAYYGQIGLKKVILPYTLTSIGAYAFQNCIHLSEVEIYVPADGDEEKVSALGSIDAYAFNGCYELSSFAFEAAANLQSIGNCAFEDTAFETLDLSKNTLLKDLGQYAFAYIDALTEVKGLPATVTTIGIHLFDYDVNLEKADLSGTKLKALANYTFDHCHSLTTVELPTETLTSIGNYAFAYCASLTEMDLAKFTKLTHIGVEPSSTTTNGSDYVFRECTSLERVTFPDSLIFIGSHAFSTCTALTEIDLSNTKITALHTRLTAPTSLTTALGNTTYMFQGCSNLKKVVLPETCTYIGNSTFQNCTSLDTINISNIKMIGQYAFDNTGFTEVTLPSAMTGTAAGSAMGAYVFRNCEKLQKVTIPDEVVFTGTYTFQNCHALTTVVYGDGSKVTTIGAYTFDGDEKLENINVPESVTTVGMGAFRNCASLHSFDFKNITGGAGSNAFNGSGLRSIYLTNALNKNGSSSIGDSAFANCLELTDVTVAPEVISFYSNAFKGCTALKTVKFEEGSQFQRIYSSVFEGCTSLTDVIFEGEMSAFEGVYKTSSTTYNSVFKDCTSLEEIDFSGMTNEAFISLNKNLFQGCTALKTVKLPAQIEDLGEYTFAGCSSLASIEFPESVKTIGTHCFEGTGLTTVEIPYTVTKIGVGAFADCQKLTKFEPQKDAEGNATFTASENGAVLFDETGALVASVPNIDWAATKAEFTVIGEGAFDSVHGISTLELPEGLTTIGDYAFRGSDVVNLVVPASVTSIGAYAFAESDIKTIVFKGSAEALDASTYLFDGCTNLTSVTLPEGLTTIGNYMFRGCTNLEHVDIPSSVTTIGAYAFSKTAISEAHFERIAAIGKNAFEYTHLTEVVIPETLVDVGADAFAHIESLQSVTIKGALINCPSTTTGTSPYTAVGIFQECENLTTVVIESGTQIIGTNWFFHDMKLENVTLPDTIVEIKNYAFAMCTTSDNHGSGGSLKEITIPASITTMGTGVFVGTNIEKFVYPEGVSGTSATGTSTFEGVTSLKYVKIPSTIDSFNAYTFRNCTGLEYVELAEGGSTQISNAVFYGCTNLKYIELPASTMTFIKTCFAKCTNLRLLVKPSVMTCPANAFYDGTDTIDIGPQIYFEQSQYEVLSSLGTDYLDLGDHVHYGATQEMVLNDLKTIDNWTIPDIEW